MLLEAAGSLSLKIGNVLILGAGTSSCATMVNLLNQQDARVWRGGFWSGANSMSAIQVGHHTDNEGIYAEIEKTCRDDPSQTLADAAAQAYRKLRTAKR